MLEFIIFVLFVTITINVIYFSLQWFETRLVGSLFVLYNLSRDITNYPAFFFCNTINEIILYTHIESSDLASIAKYILTYWYMYLDCDQLPALKFTKEEMENCISLLATATNSPDFQANGISVNEFLQILIGATHPSLLSANIKFASVKFPVKKKGKVKSESVKLSYFDEKMLEVAEELAENSLHLIESDLSILSLLQNILSKEQFQIPACQLLWNLLHHKNVRANVSSNFSGICKCLEAMKFSKSSDVQLACHCCLWLLGTCTTGMFHCLYMLFAYKQQS